MPTTMQSGFLSHHQPKWLSPWLCQGNYVTGNLPDVWSWVDVIVNVSKEEPQDETYPAPLGKHYLHRPFEDGDAQGFLMVLDDVMSALVDAKQAGKKVLVHCMAGVSRSVSLCLAYALLYGLDDSSVLQALGEQVPRDQIRSEDDFYSWAQSVCDLTGTAVEQIQPALLQALLDRVRYHS